MPEMTAAVMYKPCGPEVLQIEQRQKKTAAKATTARMYSGSRTEMRGRP
jgi:hypothetical protein